MSERIGRGLRRALADMLGVLVNALQERQQVVMKRGVALRTPQTPHAAKLLEGDPAAGTGDRRRLLFGFRHRTGIGCGVRFAVEVIIIPQFRRGHPPHLYGAEILLGTRFAQMHHLGFTQLDFGDVKRRGLRTSHAFLHRIVPCHTSQ